MGRQQVVYVSSLLGALACHLRLCVLVVSLRLLLRAVAFRFRLCVLVVSLCAWSLLSLWLCAVGPMSTWPAITHTMTLCDFTLCTFKALWILPGSFFRVALRVCLCRCPPFTAVEECACTYRPTNLWTCFRAFALSRFHAFALSLVCVVRLCCSLALCVLALRSTNHHTLALCDFTLFTLKALLI